MDIFSCELLTHGIFPLLGILAGGIFGFLLANKKNRFSLLSAYTRKRHRAHVEFLDTLSGYMKLYEGFTNATQIQEEIQELDRFINRLSRDFIRLKAYFLPDLAWKIDNFISRLSEISARGIRGDIITPGEIFKECFALHEKPYIELIKFITYHSGARAFDKSIRRYIRPSDKKEREKFDRMTEDTATESMLDYLNKHPELLKSEE